MRWSLRSALRSTTAIGRAVAPMRWLECFMAFGHATGWNEDSPGIRWLRTNPCPMFYTTWVEDGRLNIEFHPGLRALRLQVPTWRR